MTGATRKALAEIYAILMRWVQDDEDDEVENIQEKPGQLQYSAESMGAMSEVGDRFREKVRRIAVEKAASEGRHLVTEDDIWSATKDLVGGLLDDEGDQEETS